MAMAITITAITLFLILFAAPAPSIADLADVPFVVAHKKVSVTRLKSGFDRLVVSVDLYNQGSATAYDLSLIDDTWPQDKFDIVSGSSSTTWEKLDIGSTASHSFILESKAKGLFYGSPALIKFRAPTKAALQEAYSTSILPLDILADKPSVNKFEWAKKLLAKYGSQVSALTLVGSFIYIVAKPSTSKSSKKRR